MDITFTTATLIVGGNHQQPNHQVRRNVSVDCAFAIARVANANAPQNRRSRGQSTRTVARHAESETTAGRCAALALHTEEHFTGARSGLAQYMAMYVSPHEQSLRACRLGVERTHDNERAGSNSHRGCRRRQRPCRPSRRRRPRGRRHSCAGSRRPRPSPCPCP
jgi:hypothetical protein